MTYELALMEREELGEKRGREKNLLEDLRSAMESLKIPQSEQSHYMSKLNS